jgi:hypothetical protein
MRLDVPRRPVGGDEADRQRHGVMSASGQFGRIRLYAGTGGHANLRLGDGLARVLEAEVAAGDGWHAPRLAAAEILRTRRWREMDSNRRYPKDDYKLFIGDGILAVFPIEDMATTRSVARDAVAAAHTALAAVRVLGRHLIV